MPDKPMKTNPITPPEDDPEDLTEELPPVEMSNIPPASPKQELLKQLPVFFTELLLTGAMLGVYALLGYFSSRVLFGALLGCGAMLLYFALLVLSVLKAEKKDSPTAGQLTVRLFYILRTAILFGVLVAALSSKLFDPLATALPVLFYRLAILLSELLRRKGEKAS